MLENKLTFELLDSAKKASEEVEKHKEFKLGQNNHHLLHIPVKKSSDSD
jgi:hypothetical protein